MRNHQKSRHILENPHAMVGMRIYNEFWRWDFTIEKVTAPYFYPYAVCLDHQDRPDLWAVCYDQNDARIGRTNPILLCKEYCAYCVAEFIAYEHVTVTQENGYGHWCVDTMCEARRKGMINLATDAVFELGYPDEKAVKIATYLVDNRIVSETAEYTSHIHADIENRYGENVLWGNLEQILT